MGEEGMGMAASASVRKIPEGEEHPDENDGPSRRAWMKLGILLVLSTYAVVDLALEAAALLL